MTIKQKITEELRSAIKELGIEDPEPQVDYPADPKHGDYSSNVALIAAKKLGKNPVELGEEIVKELRIKNQELRLFEKIEVVKPGFINFSLTSEFLVLSLPNG